MQDNPFAKEDLAIITDDYIIPLDTQGTTIFCDTRSPTEVELQQLPRVILTSAINWDPQKVQFPSHNPDRVVLNTSVQNTSDFCLHKTTYDPEHFSSRIIQQIQVDWPEGEQNPTIQQDIPSARTVQSRERHLGTTPADISERWYVGLSQANTTLNATTQRLVRSTLLPLSRRYRADHIYERPRICDTIYTDAMGGRHKSLDGNKYAQVFANDSFFAVSYPMDKKSSAGQALKQFIADFGIPDQIVCDGLGEQMGKRTEFTATVRKHSIDIHLTEPDRHIQSKVVGVIHELRKRWFRVMLKQCVPNRLWDYGICWVCEIMQCTASNSGRLHGRTPLEQLTGETPDISEYLDFSFYYWCWYNDSAGLRETKLGRWLGVSHHVGSLMSYWVLTLKGHMISRTTVSRVTNLEKQQTDEKHCLAEFDSAITARFNDDVHVLVEGGKIQPQDWSEPLDDLDFLDEFHNVVSNPEVPEADQQFTLDAFDDRYLNMELALPHGDEATPQYAKVTKRLRDANGIPIGTADDNPILDTRMYKV